MSQVSQNTHLALSMLKITPCRFRGEASLVVVYEASLHHAGVTPNDKPSYSNFKDEPKYAGIPLHKGIQRVFKANKRSVEKVHARLSTTSRIHGHPLPGQQVPYITRSAAMYQVPFIR
uniref:Uncharacterized protein n=1 Tax=Candidatus Kentrum sp. LFY TaxID=2126342 RepID=A0A450W7Q4_9GAMM|nr:MAG: hypothetical protein BECKLFY1418C_GA0070996_100233 [Candidatus Kentron sp. LFY]